MYAISSSSVLSDKIIKKVFYNQIKKQEVVMLQPLLYVSDAMMRDSEVGDFTF